MITHPIDLVPIWTFLLGVAVFYYVLFDGFDLGVGILYGLTPDSSWRDKMMQSIAPVWDGNETWLVLGIVGLFAAFPLAYVIIVPAVYFPIVIMLLSLVFRGVSFEFRFKNTRLKKFWDRAFNLGSTIAAFAQGVVLGTFIQGFKVSGRAYTGTSWDWITGFALFCGVAVVAGYSLLGAGWLIMKTEGPLQAWARRMARIALLATVAAIFIVSLWTAFANTYVSTRWFTFPQDAYFLVVPFAAAGVAFVGWWSLYRDRGPEFLPFLVAVGLFFFSFLGIGISLWPMIVPYHYGLWQAAAAQSTQVFLLIGTLFLIPIILFYTGWSYWVFRGKVKDTEGGYH